MTEEEMFCQAAVVLGLDQLFQVVCEKTNKRICFYDICAKLYDVAEDIRDCKDPTRLSRLQAKERGIRSEVALYLRISPFSEIRAGLQAIAEHVRTCDDQKRFSPMRANIRKVLLKLAASADRVAIVLDDAEAAAATGCGMGHAMSSNVAARDRVPAGPMGGSDRTVSNARPDIEFAMKPGRTAMEKELALRAAVEQRASRQEDAKSQADISQVSDDLEFLAQMGALGRLQTMVDLHGKTPPGPVPVPPEVVIRQTLQDMLQDIRAREIPREADLMSAGGMRALSLGISNRVKYYLEPHQGSDKLSDALGSPSGRRLCAIAATDLLEAFRGRKPAHTHFRVRRLNTLIWALAADQPIPIERYTDINSNTWQRSLRGVRERNAFESRSLVSKLLFQHGVVTKAVGSD